MKRYVIYDEATGRYARKVGVTKKSVEWVTDIDDATWHRQRGHATSSILVNPSFAPNGQKEHLTVREIILQIVR